MRTIIISALVALTAACATVPESELRLTEARSLARQYAEENIDMSLASLSRSGVLGDIDCDQETGVDAEQCVAFTTLIANGLETLRVEERQIAMSDADDEIAALAAAIASLSDADFFTLRTNANLPAGSDLTKPISAEGQQRVRETWDALDASLSASDRRAGDRTQSMLMEILLKLAADPTAQ